ncbi:Fc.00g040560.m01.CDS01 [Cosmosporella sp. VM-42]
MSRRLVNRSGAPARTTTDLPHYESPSCPLNDAARRALGELSNNRGTLVYHSQLKESMRFLGGSIGDLHERLREGKDRLQGLRTRREEKGSEKSQDEERLETHVEELEERVRALTDKHEVAVRELIDRSIELEDEVEVLGDLYTHAATENINAPTESRLPRTLPSDKPEASPDPEDDPDLNPPTAPSTLDIFKKQLAEKEREYTSMTPHQRYAVNNDYAAFKKLWHDAMAGEDGPPLPDASRWFTRDGQPVMGRPGEDAGGDDDSDDDIAVAREVLSINCPLTLRVLDQPYSNRKCKHTFEKAAILDYLPPHGEVQCPQTGCSQMFSRMRFDQDFYLDQVMMKRIQRTRRAQEQQDMMEDDDEDDEDDDGVIVRGQRMRPGGAVAKREKMER